jgi:XTP/dITP diphosphohydrolase
MQILIATNNAGKTSELLALLKGLPAEIVTPRDLGIDLDVDESGTTCAENASLKAQAFAKASALITLSDDTGLEVDALNGRPGVYSARYVNKPDATDADRRAKLLHELKEFPRPWEAHFHCTVAVVAPDTSLRLFDGAVYGEIVPEESGEHGFGYDRLFYIAEMGKTLAACVMEEKNQISHRAKAVKQALPYLRSLIQG